MKEEYLDAGLVIGIFLILLFFLFKPFRFEVESRLLRPEELPDSKPTKRFLKCGIPKDLLTTPGTTLRMCIDPDTGEEFPIEYLDSDGRIMHLEDFRPQSVARGKELNGLTPKFYYR